MSRPVLLEAALAGTGMSRRKALQVTAVALAAACLAIYGLAGHRAIAALYSQHWFAAVWRLTAWGAAKPLAFCYTIADAMIALFAGTLLAVAAILGLGAQRLCRWFDGLAGRLLEARLKTAVIGGLASLAAVSAVAVLILDGFPNSADEYCYVYQAETMAAGRFYNTPHELQDFFNSTHIAAKDGRLFSVYPPGWPVLLAAAMRVLLPLWLVNPLLGMLSLLVLFLLGRRLYGDKTALLAVLLLAVSPYFLFNAASFFAHQLTSLLMLLTYYHAVRLLDSGRARDAVLVGFWFGWAFVTRGYTSLLCAAPLVVYVAWRKPGALRHLILAALGALPWAAFLMAYNHAITGEALLLPQAWAGTNRYWFTPEVATRGITIFASLVIRFLGWTPLFLLLIYFVSLAARGRASRAGTGFVLLVLMLGMFFYTDSGGNQYGARYYYEAYPFVLLFCAGAILGDGCSESKRGLDRLLAGLLAVSVLTVVPAVGYHMAAEHRMVAERRDLYAQVARHDVHNAVVFVSTGAGVMKPMPAGDLIRNDPDFAGDVLYALDMGDANVRLMEYYPDRQHYRYAYDTGERRGGLVRLPVRLDQLPGRTGLPYSADP